MIKQLFAALLGAEAPPVAPADLTPDPRDEIDPTRGRGLGWVLVGVLALLIAGGAVSLVLALTQD